MIDAAVALSWLFPRVKLEEAALADQALDAMASQPAIVPALWHAEIANGLLAAEAVASAALAREESRGAHDRADVREDLSGGGRYLFSPARSAGRRLGGGSSDRSESHRASPVMG